MYARLRIERGEALGRGPSGGIAAGVKLNLAAAPGFRRAFDQVWRKYRAFELDAQK